MKDLKLWATIVTVTILAWAISTTVTDMTNGFITAGYVFGGFVTLLGIFAAADYMKKLGKGLAMVDNPNFIEVTSTERADLWERRAN